MLIITKWSFVGLGGTDGPAGCEVRILAGTIGFESDVSVLSGLGGGIGGKSATDRTAIPGPRAGRTRCIGALLLLLLLLMAAAKAETETTGGICTTSAPSCISAAATRFCRVFFQRSVVRGVRGGVIVVSRTARDLESYKS